MPNILKHTINLLQLRLTFQNIRLEKMKEEVKEIMKIIEKKKDDDITDINVLYIIIYIFIIERNSDRRGTPSY